MKLLVLKNHKVCAIGFQKKKNFCLLFFIKAVKTEYNDKRVSWENTRHFAFN